VAAVTCKRHREQRMMGVYTCGTAVCAALSAAQMGVYLMQNMKTRPKFLIVVGT